MEQCRCKRLQKLDASSFLGCNLAHFILKQGYGKLKTALSRTDLVESVREEKPHESFGDECRVQQPKKLPL